jgi:hypothetical protein
MERISSAEYRRRMGAAAIDGISLSSKRPQIRIPAPQKMNKTEAEWMEHLTRPGDGINVDVRYEPITFRLPSGTRYTPDFMRRWADGKIEFWEVKGPHIHSSASIRAFKEAKSAFLFFDFKFAQKTKDGWVTT